MMIFHSYVSLPEGITHVKIHYMIPSGKRLHNYGKIHHAINGKTHYFYGHFQ